MHIIYKTPEDLIKKIKNNFALMLKDGLLKENIDGESLLWALRRILKRNEERKILMVISDGAPVDDSTISSNSSNCLEKHLKKTIKIIENETNVEIIAIGIGHDVTKYYKKAVTIHDPGQLGGVMIEKFCELFEINK
jgi:cobaltochelatase CobT